MQPDPLPIGFVPVGPEHYALLQAWLDVYSERYLLAKNQRPVDPDSAAHRQLAAAQA